MMTDWLQITRGSAPLVVAFPHVGRDLPPVSPPLRSDWLARRDTDWWVDKLYAFAADLGATMIHTRISRSVIDLNRDPSGQSLYPGQTTTELCPTTTFDGDALYAGVGPDEAEVARRRDLYFTPYHEALNAELQRLRTIHPRVVLYDAHSIRSRVPRLFDGELPHLNIGTNGGTTCAPELRAAVEQVAEASVWTHVTDGRFRGGWTTRHYGRPESGLHAIQMELAMRSYLDEPQTLGEADWPVPYDPARAAELIGTLHQILSACLHFARTGAAQ